MRLSSSGLILAAAVVLVVACANGTNDEPNIIGGGVGGAATAGGSTQKPAGAAGSGAGGAAVSGGTSGGGGQTSGGFPAGGAGGKDGGGGGEVAGGGNTNGGGDAGNTNGGGDAGNTNGGGTGGSTEGGAGGAGATGGSAGSGDDAGTGGSLDTGPDATITAGTPGVFLLKGTIVSPDDVYDGEVLIQGGLIVCADTAAVCEGNPAATGATVIDTKGIIAPGMIDTHNHILFDIFDDDDWYPAKVYTNHNQWTAEAGYKQMLATKHCFEDSSEGKPAWCPQKWNGAANSLKCELDKYGETKSLIAGTTSVVGLPGTSSACFGSVARSIDTPQNDLGTDLIQTSSLFPPATSSADGVCANYASGKTDAYLIHVGEGLATDASVIKEFGTLGTVTTTDGCLYAHQTSVTHGTCFGDVEFQKMADTGMTLTWSPASNVALYGDTANIPLARSKTGAASGAGITIALAPDWSMGGSQNLLDEMRFAKKWDHDHWNDSLTAKDIFAMTTKNAAVVAAVDQKLGQIKAGMIADLFVIGGDPTVPYDSILAATPKDVRLVMVGGVVLFGDDQLVSAGPAAPGCETLDACGRAKFACIAETDGTNKLNQTFASYRDVLESALEEVDAIATVDASLCGGCGADQACFARTDLPNPATVCPATCTATEGCYPRGGTPKPASCMPACGAGQACYSAGGGKYTCQDTNQCQSLYSCEYTGHKYAPITPVVKCPLTGSGRSPRRRSRSSDRRRRGCARRPR